MTSNDATAPSGSRTLSRRQWIQGTLGALAGTAMVPAAARTLLATPKGAPLNPPRYCLNTSTIRGANSEVGLVDQIRIAAEAGYDAIEPWLRDINRFKDEGGSVRDLGQQIADAGLAVPSAIGFARWAVDNTDERAAGLEEARRDMATLAAIGGTRLAAPPVGLTDQRYGDLLTLAERYATLLELGTEFGVVPQLEVWGFSQTFQRLGEVAFVAVESGRPDACILPDVYHLYKGGSSLEGLLYLNGASIHVFHLNDYPAEPPRESISDADRVFPGDGVAPFDRLREILSAIGFNGTFSLELFNRTYWTRDPLEVAREGLRKMKAVTGDPA
ncbi:sugar phosphate isomerase/epimerase family protein [Tautonia rosea]|uniref:sugar phosphate isomerase/epimerase family protein n=1 Tax=Tautonia rosea TaxID=2728037 RepID=UPI0014732617|nr:sugar phosphate isomerase/epimerase family protein [Tautonia rosea]